MDQNLNILIMANYGAEYSGNFIPSLIELTNKVNDNNGSVIFVLPERARNKDWCKKFVKEQKVYFIEEERSLKRLKKINNIINNNNCNKVYTHFGYDNEIGILSWIHPKVDFFKHSHTDMNEKLSKLVKIRISIKNKTLMYKIKTIAVNKKLCENKNDFYVPNGLVFNRFDNNNSCNEMVRLKYSIKKEDIFILMFGWHLDVKGVDIACRAIELLVDKYPNLKLGIVYSEKLGIDSVIDYIKSNVSKDIFKNIILLKQSENVCDYHMSADIFLSASRSEGFPYSILEALYLGEIVVFSDISGTRWVDEYSTTIKFESEDYISCAKSIESAIKMINIENIDELKNKSKDKIIKNYSIDKWVNRIIKIIA